MSEVILSPKPVEKENRQANEWSPAKVIYTGLMAFNLLSFLWLLITGSGIEIPPIIWITRIATAPLAIYLGKLWKDRGFQILSIYTIFFFFRVFIPKPDNAFNAEFAESIFSALWLFAGCYGMGKVIDARNIKKLLIICANAWIIFVTFLCCLGIYVAWTGQTVYIPGTKAAIDTSSLRLEILSFATVTGAFVSITILIAIIMAINAKRKRIKALYIIMIIPLCFALSLTDTRSSFISCATGMGIVTLSIVYEICKKKQVSIIYKYDWRPWFFSIIVMIAAFVFALWAIINCTPLFNTIKTKGIIPKAYAEISENEELLNRGLSLDSSVLSGRYEIWKAAIEHMQKKPISFLIGESKIRPLITNHLFFFSHCHSIYLQILFESGLLGLVLILLFIFIVLHKSIYIITQLDLPLIIRLLPAIPMALLLGDVVECNIWLRSSQLPMNAIFFITVGIICSQLTRRQYSKQEK